VSRPDVVFADEPTGNLDSRSSGDVLGFLHRSVRDFDQTVVMVTHDPTAASYADRVLFLADGTLQSELLDPTAESVLDAMKKLDADQDDQDEGARRTGGAPDDAADELAG
jgi:putative ABC transport system ATP-binding protein